MILTLSSSRTSPACQWIWRGSLQPESTSELSRYYGLPPSGIPITPGVPPLGSVSIYNTNSMRRVLWQRSYNLRPRFAIHFGYFRWPGLGYLLRFVEGSPRLETGRWIATFFQTLKEMLGARLGIERKDAHPRSCGRHRVDMQFLMIASDKGSARLRRIVSPGRTWSLEARPTHAY